jgi:hypothetical protein
VIEPGELELLVVLVDPQAAASVTRPAPMTSAPARLLTMPRFFICSSFSEVHSQAGSRAAQELSAMCCRDRQAGQAWA